MTQPDPIILAAAIARATDELRFIPDDQPETRAQAEALIEAARAGQAVQDDAERWRALMSSQRIRVIGSAGMVDPTTGNLRAPADGYVHIGIELWSLHSAPHPSAEFPQDRYREQLTFYVDFLRARAPGDPT